MSTTERQSFNLYQLIGAPLVAFVQAECMVAQTTAEFIQRMGFVAEDGANPDDIGALRMVTFVHERRGSDGRVRAYKVEVPLLSLLPIPTMQVKEADIEFGLKIFELRRRTAGSPAAWRATDDDPGRGGAAAGTGIHRDFLSGDRFEMVGAMGRMPSSGTTGQQAIETQLNVKVRLEQADMPAGLVQLVRLMDESVKATLIDDSDAA
jgi:hypothetical protein